MSNLCLSHLLHEQSLSVSLALSCVHASFSLFFCRSLYFHISLFLSLALSPPSLYLSLSVSLSLSFFLSLSLSLSLSFFPSLSLSLSLSPPLCLCLSLFLSLSLSLSLSISLLLSLSLSLAVYENLCIINRAGSGQWSERWYLKRWSTETGHHFICSHATLRRQVSCSLHFLAVCLQLRSTRRTTLNGFDNTSDQSLWWFRCLLRALRLCWQCLFDCLLHRLHFYKLIQRKERLLLYRVEVTVKKKKERKKEKDSEGICKSPYISGTEYFLIYLFLRSGLPPPLQSLLNQNFFQTFEQLFSKKKHKNESYHLKSWDYPSFLWAQMSFSFLVRSFELLQHYLVIEGNFFRFENLLFLRFSGLKKLSSDWRESSL